MEVSDLNAEIRKDLSKHRWYNARQIPYIKDLFYVGTVEGNTNL